MSNFKSAFTKDGNWYKGNLHTHTTISDGLFSQQDIIRDYKEKGYDFLSITDHNIYSNYEDGIIDGILMLQGVERDVFVTGEQFKVYHIVGISNSDIINYEKGQKINKPDWTGMDTAQEMIDELKEHGNLAILAHPVWSRNELEDIISLENLDGIEIYNYGCDVECQHGNSELYWDSFLRRGMKVWGFATDDIHVENQKFGGWIVVKATSLTKHAISEAIYSGNFYSSSGPEFFEFYVSDNEAVVECSAVTTINYITYDHIGSCYYEDNQEITSAKHQLNGAEKYVRVEITDLVGRKAWSNPIFLG